MTSRRPMARSYSGNGRTSSFNDEESSPSVSRSEGRNTYLSNVRPENRSTLCSVMAQLTEDIQPSFDTTLKSKAVSETCNVKFCCVVSGYPAPELKWYKDDMEMDRYCGLPKYEIRKNGKTHTLHIYNCTLDDAAIYQVSAVNSKGIVSCSGVLEVGTMSEYMIHQRFFSKLKQKAENKKKELEESKRRARGEPARGSPERSLRKRPVPPPEEEERPTVQEPEAVEQPGASVSAAAVVEPNGVSAEPSQATPATPAEKMDVSAPAEAPSTETSAKKVRISNGVDAGPSGGSSGSSRRSSNGGRNSYDGGFGLAQFLAETLQSQAAEEKQHAGGLQEEKQHSGSLQGEKQHSGSLQGEKQHSGGLQEEKQHSGSLQGEKQHSGGLQEEKQHTGTLQGEKQHSGSLQGEKQHSGSAGTLQEEKPAERDAYIADAGKEKEREQEREEEKEKDWALAGRREREDVREREVSTEREKDKQRSHKAHASDKDHNIQASISSVLHSVKDFFFGKHKKDSHDQRRHGEREADHADAASAGPSPPPSRRHAPCRPEERGSTEHLGGEVTTAPTEAGRPQRPPAVVAAVADGPPVTPERLKTRAKKLRAGVNALHTEGVPPPREPPSERAREEEAMDVTMEVTGVTEVMEVTEVRSGAKEAASMPGPPALGEVASQMVADAQAVPVTQKEQRAPAVSPEPERQAAAPEEPQPPLAQDPPGPPQSHGPRGESPAAIFPSRVVSATDDKAVGFGATTESLRGDDVRDVGEADDGRDAETQENNSPDYLGRSEKAEVKTETRPQTDINRATELATPSLEERIEKCGSETPKQVPVILIMDEDAVVTERVEGGRSEARVTPCPGERRVESSAAALVPGNLEKGGLKITQECGPVVAGSAGGCDPDTKGESIIPALQGQGRGGVSEVAFASSVREDVEVGSPGKLETREQVVQRVASAEARAGDTLEGDEAVTLGMEGERKTEGKSQAQVTAAVNESKSHTETQREGDHFRISKEPSKEANPDTGISDVGGIVQNVPEKHILRVNEHMIIPKIEIVEPDVTEPVQNLAIPARKPKSEPPVLLRGDAIEVPEETPADHGTAISPATGSFAPPRRGARNQEILPPTEKVQDVAQAADETEARRGEKPSQQTAQGAPQTSHASVPTVDVSYADDSKLKEDADALVKPPVLDTPQLHEAHKVPSFVVPPISIICDDSPPETEPPSQSETLVAFPRGTQNPEASRRNVTDGSPSTVNRTPGITTDALSSGKPTEEITITDTEKVKPLKEARTESDITVEEVQKEKPPMSLAVKPPTPQASPGSLRRFLSKAAPGSDATTPVPAITVGDAQSDRTGDELSGGSTPTSSLSCESSPRLKRKDSLSLIRSATPEELASGARRKIFVPKAKAEEGEGVGVGGAGALDVQGKKENPYMSPGQARRASLLQASTVQTPPGERQESPYMSPGQARRAALLQGSAGPQSPPGERQENPFPSPSLARRAALLQGSAGPQSPPGERQENPFPSPSLARRAALLQASTVATPPEERQENPLPSPSLARRAALLQASNVPTPPEERQEKAYMSPSQARRAALFQPPTIQETPPEERQEKAYMSPSLARMVALLNASTVQTPPEERQENQYTSPSQARRAALLQPPTVATPPGEKQENPLPSPSQARRAALLQASNVPTPPEKKQENPLPSPSQARRAALLQASNVPTPPEERQEKAYMSPSQARRAALLQPPTIQQTPPEERQEKAYMSPSQARRAALLQPPTAASPAMEKRSPLLSRRKATLDVPRIVEETTAEDAKPEEKPAEKEKLDPFKAPQVIRKIRGEPFADASGHLKLWCQFFNVLSDSTVKWFRDEEEILERGDESQMALAVVQASTEDCGVYGCTIKNEYGTDSTDYLLSIDVLSGILLKEELEVGEEIEMTPLLFSKGLANTGSWGEKFFGRVMTEHAHLGEGCAHKASRVKVIYGLDPVFESGTTCIMKVKNPIAYGTKAESNLAERNLEITKQDCKVQNMIREYCKIFAAEARSIDNFGLVLEIIPQYLMYRPANSVPYATVETDVDGIYRKYCTIDAKRRLTSRAVSEVDQKCCTFQHWIHQWTHGNLLVTQMEGIEAKITNVRVVTKSKGYQGLTEEGSPEVFEQFLTHHQCNYYCGLLDLRTLKTMDSLQQPGKIKGSRSPLMNRRYSTGSFSPQLLKKGAGSPQLAKKASSSPKVPRKAAEDDKTKTAKEETPPAVQMS